MMCTTQHGLPYVKLHLCTTSFDLNDIITMVQAATAHTAGADGSDDDDNDGVAHGHAESEALPPQDRAAMRQTVESLCQVSLFHV